MANRYWVGGNGTWNTTSTTNWSATSGGAGGASAPTSADVAIFDANSGASTVTLGENVTAFAMTYSAFTGTFDFGNYKMTFVGSGNVLTGGTGYTATGSKNVELTYSGSLARSCFTGAVTDANAFNIKVTAGTGTVTVPTTGAKVGSLDFTGFSGSWTSTGTQTVAGDLTLASGMTDAATSSLTISSASAQTITTNGVSFNRNVILNGAGTKTFADNVTIPAASTLTLGAGTLDATGKNVSVGTFSSSTTTARSLIIGSGTWTIQAAGTAWNTGTATNLTVSYTTGKIRMTSASAKTFAGGGASWPTLDQAGAGALTIQQSNTFANIINSVQPATITLTSGTTQTVNTFGVSGTAGNLITLNSSSAGSRATLSDVSGTINVSYVSIQDIAATGGAGWDAYTSNGNIDAGNNTGWVFDPAPSDVSVEFFMNLRSFTEPRRF